MFFMLERNSRKFSFGLLTIFLLCGFCESAISQTTWEFSGTPYAYQKAHFDSATAIVKRVLGIQMRTFGAPFNQLDSTFIQVLSEDTNYKALLFGKISPSHASGQMNLRNRVLIESATGVPNFDFFLKSYNSEKNSHRDYMVMQGHPYAWTTPEKANEFQKIVKFLVSENVVFTTPYAYYRYLTDGSIPRTDKVQVVLKLDDVRADSSYFYPCLPTFSFLSSNKIQAAFGVNKIEGMAQAQIDILHHYLSQKDDSGNALFEIWNHGLDHSRSLADTTGN
jgi:hypothetical protein